METFSLADNFSQATKRNDLSPYEMYKTRPVQADKPRTPLLSFTHTYLRALWFRVLKRKAFRDIDEATVSQADFADEVTYQNTIKLAEFLSSFLMALGSGVFLIVPLCILSYLNGRTAQLITVSVSIMVFSFATSLVIRSSGPETMAASAAYAAVHVVFLTNSPDH